MGFENDSSKGAGGSTLVLKVPLLGGLVHLVWITDLVWKVDTLKKISLHYQFMKTLQSTLRQQYVL